MTGPTVTPGDGAEPEKQQLPIEDTLLDHSVDDVLDEGYSPPDRPRADHWGETPWEAAHREPLDRRLAQELPDDAPEPERDATVAGRLVEEGSGVPGRTDDVLATDVGVDGGAPSPEEAAVHVVDEDTVLAGEQRDGSGDAAPDDAEAPAVLEQDPGADAPGTLDR